MENPFNLPPEMVADVVVDTHPVNNVAPQTAAAPNVTAFDPRKRLRSLLSIPERDRTDEQWDEIIELEIQLAPGNRVDGAQISQPNNNKARQRPNAMMAAQNAQNPHNLQNAQNPQNAKKRPRANNFRRLRNKPAGNAGAF